MNATLTNSQIVLGFSNHQPLNVGDRVEVAIDADETVKGFIIEIFGIEGDASVMVEHDDASIDTYDEILVSKLALVAC